MPIYLNLCRSGTLSGLQSGGAVYFYELQIVFLNALAECKSWFLKFYLKLRSSKAFLPSTESEAEVLATP